MCVYLVFTVVNGKVLKYALDGRIHLTSVSSPQHIYGDVLHLLCAVVADKIQLYAR